MKNNNKASRFVPEINIKWCKGCGICVEMCPKGALGLDREGKAYVANQEVCVGCRLCELICPDMAIDMIEKG